MDRIDLFPVRCLHTRIENPQEVLDEALSYKEEVKKITKEKVDTCSEYHFTDFGAPVKNKSFEKAIEKALMPLTQEENLNVDIIDYWTAFYEKGGLHEPHLHCDNIFDKCNFSGILYLSNIGGTQFFCPHNMTTANTVTVEGRMGEVFIFPSLLPHTFAQAVAGDRVIISFNLSITG